MTRQGDTMATAYATQHILTNAGEVEAALRAIRARGLQCRWSRLCIWIESPTSDSDAVWLKRLFRAQWSGKRAQWYVRADEGITGVNAYAGMEPASECEPGEPGEPYGATTSPTAAATASPAGDDAGALYGELDAIFAA